MFLDELTVHTIRHNSALFAVLLVDFAVELGEAPFARHNDVLAAGELELGPTECLQSMCLVLKAFDEL